MSCYAAKKQQLFTLTQTKFQRKEEKKVEIKLQE